MSETISYGSVELCGTGDIVEGFNLASAPVGQDVELARASAAGAINRGNRRRVFSFSVKKAPKASASAAREFIIDHDIALAALDFAAANQTTTFVYGTKTYTLDQAICTARSTQMGTTVMVDYSISGAVLAKSA